MQEYERDLMEVLIFDEIEETVGTWLRAIILKSGVFGCLEVALNPYLAQVSS